MNFVVDLGRYHYLIEFHAEPGFEPNLQIGKTRSPTG